MKYQSQKFPDFIQVISEKGVSRSLIRLFYEAIILGRFQGREAERFRIESKINSAVAAGKILNE